MFGTAVVCYLFLGGAGAGACFVLSLLGLLVPCDRLSVVVRASRTYRALFFPSYVCALCALVLGVVFLAVDLGRVDRLFWLVLSPTAAYLTVGAYALVLCVLLALALACVWGGFVRRVRRGVFVVLEVAMCLCSVAVMAYTGLLLQSMQAVPLWNTIWLPVLFVLSSVSCGFALVLAVVQFSGAAREFASCLRSVAFVDVAVVAAELLTVFFLVVSAANAVGDWQATGTSLAIVQSLSWLLQGAGAPVFWGAFVTIGLIVPLLSEIAAGVLRRFSANAALAVSACILLGGFALRWCLVEAGMHPVLAMAVLG